MRNETVNIDNFDDLMTAFDNIKCPYWSLYSGSNLLHSYEDNNQAESHKMLEDIVELYCMKSAGRYTLCIYRGLKAGTIITNKTPYTNSINFRLCHNQLQALGEAAYGQRYGDSKESLAEIKRMYQENLALQLKIKTLELQKEKPEPETTIDKIAGVVDAFGLTDVLPHLGRALVDRFITPGRVGVATALSGAKQNSAPLTEQQLAEKDKLLNEALDILEESVPDLPEVLHKFALFSRSNNAQFQLYINAIRNG